MMLDHVKKWWLAHSVWVTGILYFLLPSLNHYVNTHPKTVASMVISVIVGRVFQGKAVPTT